jgi:hypothetical protein
MEIQSQNKSSKKEYIIFIFKLFYMLSVECCLLIDILLLS